jgi:hypothetical protein
MDGIVPLHVFFSLSDDLLEIYDTRLTSFQSIRTGRHLPYIILTLHADIWTREELRRLPQGSHSWAETCIHVVGDLEGNMDVTKFSQYSTFPKELRSP